MLCTFEKWIFNIRYNEIVKKLVHIESYCYKKD